MCARYENPVLYSAINQPVDRKTGLVVQQEVPVTQLGRMSQKHDQGFLDFVADRAVAKYYGKKGKRGTAIFLPDRIRFTKDKFRSCLFYREIKEFYKSDPKTFCFVLYVINEKTAKRTYEVYSCDTMQDVLRIEDLLGMSKHTANRLLVDPVPVPLLSERRRSLPMAPDRKSVLECPHCNQLSRIESDRLSNVSDTLSEPVYKSNVYGVRKESVPRARSLVATNQRDDWIHINDRWRESGEYADERYARQQRKRRSRSNWYEYEYDRNLDIAARQPRTKSANVKNRTGVQVRPYHATSTYGRPYTLNQVEDSKRLLQSGKPRLNRETMQIEQPYVEQPQTRVQSRKPSTQYTHYQPELDQPLKPKDMNRKSDLYGTQSPNAVRKQFSRPYPSVEIGSRDQIPNPVDAQDVTIIPVQMAKVNRSKPPIHDIHENPVSTEHTNQLNNSTSEHMDTNDVPGMYAKRFSTNGPLNDEDWTNGFVNGNLDNVINTYSTPQTNEAVNSNVKIIYVNGSNPEVRRQVKAF